MVNLSVVEQKILDDPEIDQSIKENLPQQKTEYKEKVLKAKETAQKMLEVGEEKGIPFGEIDRDIEEYLLSNGLTSFDLRTDGDRKNSAYLEAFLHGFNNKFKDIAKSVVPELIPTSLTINPFDPEFLEKDKAKKKEIENMLEELFTEEIPGVGKIIDKSFTPESLGERMADQAGESLVEFLPMMIAPEIIAAKGPVEGFGLITRQNPKLIGSISDFLNNTAGNILNTYIKTPGKAFIADISASIGFGAGEQFGEEVLRPAAGASPSVGYKDTPGLIETTSGLTGATIGMLLTDPRRTVTAIPKFFGDKGAPIVNRIMTSFKNSREKKAANFFKPILEAQEKEIVAAKDIQNLAVDKTGKKLNLTTAEETYSPGIGVQQFETETKMAGIELDNVTKRRINNINTMDEVLSTTVPKTDKDFSWFIDRRQGSITPIVKKLDDQITVAEGQAKDITETAQPKLKVEESGQALRTEIETAQFNGAQDAVTALNKIPASNSLADAEIVESLQILTARAFETGTQPKILTKINAKINQYLPTEKITKEFDETTKKVIETTEIIPPAKELKNQDLFDIWLSASMEETKLIGNAGIDAANKLQKLSQIKGTIYKALQKNLENVEGGPKFFDELNNYITKFEEGVIVQLRDKNVAGYPIQSESVADSFFRPNNSESMQKFISVFGDNANAVTAMKDSVLSRLANAAIDKKTNLIDVNKYKQFLANHDSALTELAKLDSTFVESLKKTPTAFGLVAERLATLDKRKAFVQGDKLKTTLNIFGNQSKKLNLGSTSEYVDAALADPKLMSNLTQRIIKANAGDPWVKAVTERLTKLRLDPKTGAIAEKEIKNMENFLSKNEESLKTMYAEMGKGYEKHFDNLKTIVNGYRRVNFVPVPKGGGAPTPNEQLKQALGTDIPQVWSRAFAVQSGRTGWKFIVAEQFNRFLNTVGLGHYDKIMKEAIYNPQFAETLAKMANAKGQNATVGDFRSLYGFLAKINGTIGSVSSDTDTNDVTMADERETLKSITNPMAPTPDTTFSRPDPNSRLANVNIANPVGIRPSPVDPGTSGTDIASINPNTRARGVEIFGADDAIFGMAQGGIMNARKPIQRVA
jgi:hypothetical protein